MIHKWLYLVLLCPYFVLANVTLNNGRVVPTDSMLVFVFLGHSNMSGRALYYGTENPDSMAMIHSIYDDVDSNIWQYHIEDIYNTRNIPTGTWIPARWRISNDQEVNYSCLEECLGPPMPFLKKLRSYYPQHHLGVIHVAGGTSQLQMTYINDSPVYSRYLWSQIKAALMDLQGKVRFAGVITMIGMVEQRLNPSVTSYFRRDLDTLITRIRTLSGEPNIPFLVSDLEQGVRKSLGNPDAYYIDRPTGDTVTKHILQAQDEIPFTRMIHTEWSMIPWVDGKALYFAGTHHYNRVGMLKFAEATLDAYLPIVNIPTYCSPGESCDISSSSYAPLSSSSSSVELSSSSSTIDLSSSSSSLEVSSSSLAIGSFTILKPDSAQIFSVGDTIPLQWTASDEISDAYPEVSLDLGRTWLSIGWITSILRTDSAWGSIHWVIPSEMLDIWGEAVPVAGKSLRLRFTTYGGDAKATVPIFVNEESSSIPYAQPIRTPAARWLRIYDLLGRYLYQ